VMVATFMDYPFKRVQVLGLRTTMEN